MRTMGKMNLFTMSMLALWLMMGCETSTTPPEEAGDDQPPVVSDEVVTSGIDDSLREMFREDKADEIPALRTPVLSLGDRDLDGAEILDDGLRFSQPTTLVRSLKEGDTITSGVVFKPFLRRIKAIRDEQQSLALETEDVRLGEVLTDLRTRKSLSMPDLQKDFSGTILAQSGLTKVTCSSCYVKLAPRFDFGFSLKNGWVDAFLGSLSGELESKLQVSLEVDAGQSIKQEVEVLSYRQPFVQALGPVPVWEDVGVSVLVGVQGKFDAKASLLTVGVSSKKSLLTELGLQGGKWYFNYDSTANVFTFEKIGLTTALGASAQMYVKARVEIRVYSVLKTWLGGNALAEVGIKACPLPSSWNAKGTLSLTAGAGLDLFFIDRSVERELYKMEFPASGPLPVQAICP